MMSHYRDYYDEVDEAEFLRNLQLDKDLRETLQRMVDEGRIVDVLVDIMSCLEFARYKMEMFVLKNKPKGE